MMDMEFPPASSTPGTLHFIPRNLCAFEPSKPLVRLGTVNTLIWIGGMSDTLHSVTYPGIIAQALGPTWSLMAASLGSAGLSWGVGSIARDAEDVARIVEFVRERRPGGKVVLMGHSTGCQDCMEYVVGRGAEKRPKVDGVVLQAPCSDREALEMDLPQALKQEADELALKMCREGNDKDALPNRLTKALFGRLAITARRWVDVSSPGPDHSGADDYFSSDLPIERLQGTFGRIPTGTTLLVVISGDDAAMPSTVDKQKLLQSWVDVVKSSGGSVDEINSGVVPGASHNYNGQSDEIVQNLVRRVMDFVDRLDKGHFGNVAKM